MTQVRNHDGTYFAENPADHCRHGVYVGGCGYDFMCGKCESGDPDITLRQARHMADREVNYFWRLFDVLAEHLGSEAASKRFDELAETNYFSRLQLSILLVRHVEKICDGPDDDEYMYRMHEAAIAEYNEHEAYYA